MTLFETKVDTYLPRLMRDLNITLEQASGIFGNLGTETGGFKHLQELAPTVPGSRGGYGWMQWTGPRRKRYEAWAKAQSLDPSKDETNYKYLVKETLTDEANSLRLLKLTTTVKAATETFMLKNLRPGVHHLPSRLKYAHQAYNYMNNKPPITPEQVETQVPSFLMWIINLIAKLFAKKETKNA